MSDVPLSGPYQDQWILAQQAWQDATTRINQSRMDVWKRYGFTGQTDAQGNMTNFQVDPSNPFGQYQQMGRGYAQNFQGAEDTAAARGLGGAGLGQQDSQQLRHQLRSDQDTMQTEMQQAMFGLTDEQRQADYNKNLMYPTLQAQQASDNVANQNYTPAAAPDGLNDPAPGTYSNQQAANQLGGVAWAGQFFATKQQLSQWLSKRGKSFQQWAKAHPDAAARLQ